jgi:hypothetical protein
LAAPGVALPPASSPPLPQILAFRCPQAARAALMFSQRLAWQDFLRKNTL